MRCKNIPSTENILSMASNSGSGNYMYGGKNPMNGGVGRRGDRRKGTGQACRKPAGEANASAVVEAGRGSARYSDNGTSRYHRGITSDSGSLSASTGSYGRGDTYRNGTRPCRSDQDSGHASSRSWKSDKPRYRYEYRDSKHSSNESEPKRRQHQSQRHRHQRLPVTKVHTNES